MNSTNIHPKIQFFFENELMPLAKELSQEGEIIPWVSIDTDASTYYKTRKKTFMSKDDFETGGHSTLETFETDLKSFWQNNNDEQLCIMAPSLKALAEELYFIKDESQQLSQFIYVMF